MNLTHHHNGRFYVFARGMWCRYVEHRNDSGTLELEMVPLEPLVNPGDSGPLQACTLARAPVPIVDWRAPFRARVRELDAILSEKAKERIRHD